MFTHRRTVSLSSLSTTQRLDMLDSGFVAVELKRRRRCSVVSSISCEGNCICNDLRWRLSGVWRRHIVLTRSAVALIIQGTKNARMQAKDTVDGKNMR